MHWIGLEDIDFRSCLCIVICIGSKKESMLFYIFCKFNHKSHSLFLLIPLFERTYTLTPKGPGLVMHQNHLKTAILRCDIIRFFQFYFTIFNRWIFKLTTRRRHSKHSVIFDRTDWKIIVFEVKKNGSFYSLRWVDQQTLTSLGVKFLHYIRSKFFTIVLSMMLVLYTPIFRGREGV